MNYPNPRVWIVVMTIFSALFFLNFQFKKALRNFFNNQRIQYIFKTQALNEGDVKVVLLCSSLGKQGISDSWILNKRMRQINSLSFEFVKVPFAAATLEDFVDNQLLFEKLIVYDPDYVVFQESYLFIDRVKNINFFSLRNTINFQNIRQLFEISDAKMERSIRNKNTMNIYADSLSNESDFLMYRSEIRTSPSLAKFKTELNATLLVLELPLPGHFENMMDSIRMTDQYHKIYQAEKRLTNFIYLDYPRSHPFSYYNDESHMNDKGEEVFTDWFLQTLRAIYYQ